MAPLFWLGGARLGGVVPIWECGFAQDGGNRAIYSDGSFFFTTLPSIMNFNLTRDGLRR